MKLLLLDLETSPNQVFSWGLWDQNISLSQIIDTSSVLCYSAKWYGERRTEFDSVHKSSRKKMLKGIHAMMEEADAICTYNGNSFDLPVLNREFLTNGFSPPSPYRSIDLLPTVRKQFRFASNKLGFVTEQLGLGSKTKHPGFKLWVDCMAGDPRAFRLMEKYNRQDVVLLERLYDKVRPWIKGHPNHNTYGASGACPSCGSDKLQRRGEARNAKGSYQRFQCGGCGAWSRSDTLVKHSRKRMVAA